MPRLKEIVVKDDEVIRLTTVSGQGERTCVYVSLSHDDKLIIAGGASIINRIEGEGMKEKVA